MVIGYQAADPYNLLRCTVHCNDNNYLIIEMGLLIILLFADYGGAHPTKTKLIIEFGMIGYKLF